MTVEKVHAAVITSSPGLKPKALSAIRLADEPELTISPSCLEKLDETIASNCSVLGPGARKPSRRQPVTAEISSSPYASNLLGAYQCFPALSYCE